MLAEYWIPLVVMTCLALVVIRRPFLRLSNMLTFYWLAMVVFGLAMFEISAFFVIIDESLLPQTVWLYAIGFGFFLFGMVQFRLFSKLGHSTPEDSNRWSLTDRFEAWSALPWALTVFCGLLMLITWKGVGYIPMLAGDTHITKYFQDDMAVYAQYRPLYTFALNTLSIVLTFSLAMVLQARRRFGWIMMSALCVLLLLLSAKRGPLFFPVFHVALGYSIIKRTIKPLAISMVTLLFMGVIMNITAFSQSELAHAVLAPLSTSFFVGIRELTRMLSFWDGNLLWGKTYIAGALSFIPTNWFEFKAEFNYMRYIMAIQGADPSASGGMRASYIGEALINFGLPGVMIVSYLFGTVAGAVDSWFSRSRWLSQYGFAGIVFGIAFFHVGMIGFFESGSSAFLFLLNRTVIFLLLLAVCAPRKVKSLRRVKLEGRSTRVRGVVAAKQI